MAAATSSTFAAAAKSVGLAPTSLSGRLKALEDLLECDLFAKQGRKKVLTPEGQRLLPVAQRIVDDARGLKSLAWDDGRVEPYALTLGTRFELGLSWLVPLLPVLEKEEPARTLHLAFGDTPDLVERTVRGDVDAVITSARLSGRKLKTAALHDEHYVFVTAKKLQEKKPLRSARDAIHHTLLDAGPDLPLFRYFVDGAPAGEAWEFAEILHLGAISALRARVLEGRGVAVLPRYLVDDDLRKGRLLLLLPRRPVKSDAFRLVWRTGHPREVELRALAARLATAPLQ